MPDYPFTPEQRRHLEYIHFLARGYADRDIRTVDSQSAASVLKDSTSETVNADAGTGNLHAGKAHQQAVLGGVST